MSMFHNPFDHEARLSHGCTCGRHDDQASHDADLARSKTDTDAL
jgi:hypothetical protein